MNLIWSRGCDWNLAAVGIFIVFFFKYLTVYVSGYKGRIWTVHYSSEGGMADLGWCKLGNFGCIASIYKVDSTKYLHCVQKKMHPYLYFYIFVENV